MFCTHYSDKPEERGRSGGVEVAIVIWRRLVLLPRLIAFSVEYGTLGVQRSDWLEETGNRKVKRGMLKLLCLCPDRQLLS